jgi:2-oxoglutarate dehydrogenase E1 component
LAEYVSPIVPTGVAIDTLKVVGNLLCTYPSDFDIHKGLSRILDTKKKTIESGIGIDMPTAEALAFGTLLLEGNHVRLSGQDVERGTFSQRHCVLNDQTNEKQYTPLKQLSATQGTFTVCNSSLSEFGILGFELGYSLVDPRSLICWEAQFGDFCNNAQCIIDQFISSGEKKWHQRTGLTLLLPHGYDGAGNYIKLF